MTHDERALVEGLRDKIDSLNVNLAKMMTMFGDGPGSWPRCEIHNERIDKIEVEVEEIRKFLNGLYVRIAGIGGGLAVIIFLVNLLGPVALRALGIK
jgi:hypothetical protein